MLVFWDQRLALLATPKTGSTAIAAVLAPLAAMSVQRPPLLKHTTVHRYRRFIGPYLEAASGHPFTLVAIMREPRDWLGSWYRYRQRGDVTEPAKRTNHLSFDEFVRAYCTDPQPEFAAVGAQARFLTVRQGPGADRLFRYDDMPSVTGFLEERFRMRIDLPRLNVSPPAPLDLSAATETLLHRCAAADFALYHGIPTGLQVHGPAVEGHGTS